MSDKLTKEQKDMFGKLTNLQQKMVTNIINGMKPSDAHREAGGECKTESNRRTLASQILSNPCVKEFLDSINYEAINEAIMSRSEMLERLSNLSRIDMSDLITWHVVRSTNDEGEEVEQSLWSIKESAMIDPYAMASIAEVTAGKEGFKIKQHSPLAAMKQLADMEGYNAPKEIKVSAKEELTPWGAMESGSDE